MVLMTKEICATLTPKIAGPICFITRLTAASLKLSLGIFKKPSFANQGSWNTSCNTPPTNTAHANAITGGSKYGMKNREKTIKEIFKNVGVKAGMPNL